MLGKNKKKTLIFTFALSIIFLFSNSAKKKFAKSGKQSRAEAQLVPLLFPLFFSSRSSPSAGPAQAGLFPLSTLHAPPRLQYVADASVSHATPVATPAPTFPIKGQAGRLLSPTPTLARLFSLPLRHHIPSLPSLLLLHPKPPHAKAGGARAMEDRPV